MVRHAVENPEPASPSHGTREHAAVVRHAVAPRTEKSAAVGEPRRRFETREKSTTVGEARRRFENRDPGVPPGARPTATVTPSTASA